MASCRLLLCKFVIKFAGAFRETSNLNWSIIYVKQRINFTSTGLPLGLALLICHNLTEEDV